MKRVLNSDVLQRALAWLIACYIRLVFRLTRWTFVNEAEMRRRGEAGEPFIVCFWHGRISQMPIFWSFRMPLYVLGSRHRDGRLILRVSAHFGVRSIVGSSSRGGSQALREMVQVLRGSGSVGLVPDGPRGPRMRASPGIITLAKLTGVPIFPVAFSTTSGRFLATWDRFLLAWPFGRGLFICGEPVSVAADADAAALEAARAALEERLNDITAEADRRCGQPPVAPAPARGASADSMAETDA